MANEAYRLLVLIATPKLADKATDLFKENGLPVQYRFIAEGTASSDIMDMLGLGSTDKGVLLCAVPKAFGHAMLKQCHSRLRLDAAGSGIAFTMPITGVSKMLLRMMNYTAEQSSVGGKEGTMMAEETYVLIAAIVDCGFSNEVMDAARAGGAGGGTVVHSRSVGSGGITSVFRELRVQEEKEIVLILAEQDKKTDIMRRISESCGMHSEAKGVVLSLPIDEVMGI